MENEQGDKVDMYIPRKCSSSSRIISAKDHASVQLDLVDVDPQTGRMTNNPPKRYAICGALRRMVGCSFRQDVAHKRESLMIASIDWHNAMDCCPRTSDRSGGKLKLG